MWQESYLGIPSRGGPAETVRWCGPSHRELPETRSLESLLIESASSQGAGQPCSAAATAHWDGVGSLVSVSVVACSLQSLWIGGVVCGFLWAGEKEKNCRKHHVSEMKGQEEEYGKLKAEVDNESDLMRRLYMEEILWFLLDGKS